LFLKKGVKMRYLQQWLFLSIARKRNRAAARHMLFAMRMQFVTRAWRGIGINPFK
jgi:hypothetical protein